MQMNVPQHAPIGGGFVNIIVHFIDTRLRKSQTVNLPESVSPETMAVIDQSVENFKLGNVSPAIDLSDF